MRELPLPMAIALALACLFGPAMRLSRGPRRVVLVVLEVALWLTPWLVSADRPFVRFLACVWAGVQGCKLVDLEIGVGRGIRPCFHDLLTYLINLTTAVQRRLADEPRPSFRVNLQRLGGGLVLSIPGVVLLVVCFRLDWRPIPFAVEHVAKVLAFFLAFVPAASGGAALWRLLGGWAREAMDNPFVSKTPADFWNRYNRCAQLFFLEDVFKPLGGARRPVRGVLATFAVSALIHESIFDVATRRIQGYQLAFFLIQGVAVALTSRWHPRGWWKIPAIAATLTFNLATGVLFFLSVNEMVPFYTRR